MAENKPSTPSPSPAPTSSANLAPAGESGDPQVHKLLAERQAHEQNAEEPADRKEVREAAQKAVKAVDAKLAELGYTAK